ncbi:MAG: aspartyl protease family protein [Armatimonadetes bacterium]|nr:aspartyl protease family protein [Armatimonadota bacterium]
MFFSTILATLLTAGQVTEVPFHIGDDAIIVDALVNGKPASLMYDTGFSGTVILGENLDIGKPTGTQRLTDFVGSFEAKTVRLNSLKIGERAFATDGMEVIQQPTEHYTLSYGTHCDGILGFAPFGKSVFQINFEKQRFVFYPDDYDPAQKAGASDKTFATRMLPLGVNSIELTVEAPGSKRLHMALDTGNAGYAVTHKDSLEREGLWPEGKKADFMGQSMVASGPVDTFRLSLKDLKIFGVPVPEAVFNVIDLPSSAADRDGTVGFGFLKNFNVTVDMVRRKVYFENFTGKVSEPREGEVGMLAFPDPRSKRVKVYWVVPDGPAEKAGVKAGDDLLAVNGEDVSLIGMRRLGEMMKGDAGSSVKLDLSRSGGLVRVEVVRQVLVNSAH